LTTTPLGAGASVNSQLYDRPVAGVDRQHLNAPGDSAGKIQVGGKALGDLETTRTELASAGGCRVEA
jgi:hypothetical protein